MPVADGTQPPSPTIEASTSASRREGHVAGCLTVVALAALLGELLLLERLLADLGVLQARLHLDLHSRKRWSSIR